MSSSFSGLYIASSGIFASQRALNVVSHNVANANTVGYTRQRLNIEAASPMYLPTLGMLGTGVHQKSITQVRDKFLDFKMRSELPDLGEWEEKANYLKSIEAIFNEPSTTDSGIQSVLDEFYDALNQFTKTPGELTTRTNVRAQAIALNTKINSMASKLKKLQEDINFEVKTKVTQINSYASQIRDLNEMIYRTETDGVTVANDMRDRRNVLLDELSKVANINYYEDDQGRFTVELENRALVSHFDNYELALKKREDSKNYVDNVGLYDVVWKDTQQRATVVGSTPLLFDRVSNPTGTYPTKIVARSTFNVPEIDIVPAKDKTLVADEIKTYIESKCSDTVDVTFVGNKVRIFNTTTGKFEDTSGIPDFDFDPVTGNLRTKSAVFPFEMDRVINIDIDLTNGMTESDLLDETVANSIAKQIKDKFVAESVVEPYDLDFKDGKITVDMGVSGYKSELALPKIQLGLNAGIIDNLTVNGQPIIIDNLTANMTEYEVAAAIQTKLDAAGVDVEARVSNNKVLFASTAKGADQTVSVEFAGSPVPSALGFVTEVATGKDEALLNPTTGSLKGILDIRDGMQGDNKGIPYYMNMINNFADTLMTEMNEIHQEGYGLDGSTGIAFFTINNMSTVEYENMLKDGNPPISAVITAGTDPSKTEAENQEIIDKNIKTYLADKDASMTVKKLSNGEYYFVKKMSALDVSISKDLEGDGGLNKLAGAVDPSKLPGGHVNANRLYETKDDVSLFDWGSPDDFIKSLVSNLGVDGQEANRMYQNQGVVVNQIEQNRQSISGVSLDEEMTNMIKFQHAFNASSRMVTVVDEMLDKVINGLGVVGR